MKKVLFSVFMAFLVAGFVIHTDARAAYNGTIMVDSIEVAAGDPFALAVRLSGSDVNFAGMRIPLKFDQTMLDIDSVSFAGSIKPSDFKAAGFFNNRDGSLTIAYLADFINPIPTISAADGLIATIHGHVLPGAISGQKAAVDSVNELISLGSSVFAWERVEVTDDQGNSSDVPFFEAGGIVVGMATGVDDKDDRVLPSEFALAQNYPNPFNPTTRIGFSIPKAGPVKLEVFNILGQTVRTLLDGPMTAGEHFIEFDANGLPSGIYFYRLSHLTGTATRKMALIK